MENPFLGGIKQTSQAWRDLRSKLTEDKTDHDHLRMVVEFWAKAPLVTPYLNWDDPTTWLGPWELIAERKFDPSAVALGMEYTLHLSDDGRWTADRLQLVLAATTDRSNQNLILIADDRYVLNHFYNEVASIKDASKDVVIQQRYAYINKAHQVIGDNLSGLTPE
jgi:hypothetical protein